jgi:hypothetical protein
MGPSKHGANYGRPWGSGEEFMNNPFNDKTDQLQKALEEAKVTLEEMNECGDLEERLEAAEAVVDAEYNLSRHLLSDPQEDKPEPLFP